jgi:hypothetical protein
MEDALRHRILLLLVVFTIGGSSLSAAAETSKTGAPINIPWPPWWGDLPPIESGTGLTESTAPPVAVSRPSPALMEMLSAWLVANFALPETRELPRVELVPRMRLAALRYRGLVSDRAPTGERSGPLGDLDAVQAVYNLHMRTIYLPEDWGGETPADISVLVHELVHHLQNVAGIRYSCPQEGERPAYEAQARWLTLFGKTLDEVGLDPFDVLVRTRCFN